MTSLDGCVTLDILDDSIYQAINLTELPMDSVWHLNADTFQKQTIVSHLICKLEEIWNELNFLQTLRRFTKGPISKSTVLFA